jgi:hypothetical protein
LKINLPFAFLCNTRKSIWAKISLIVNDLAKKLVEIFRDRLSVPKGRSTFAASLKKGAFF